MFCNRVVIFVSIALNMSEMHGFMRKGAQSKGGQRQDDTGGLPVVAESGGEPSRGAAITHTSHHGGMCNG